MNYKPYFVRPGHIILYMLQIGIIGMIWSEQELTMVKVATSLKDAIN